MESKCINHYKTSILNNQIHIIQQQQPFLNDSGKHEKKTIHVTFSVSERLALKSTRAAQNLIAPCVAFRVAGMQTKHINSEYIFGLVALSEM